MVTSKDHIQELNEAPLSTLSLHAVAKEVKKRNLLDLNFFTPQLTSLCGIVLAAKVHNAWLRVEKSTGRRGHGIRAGLEDTSYVPTAGFDAGSDEYNQRYTRQRV